MKCSVLMPVYNGEKYLRDAINSILNQTFKDYEFLIINDGSTDCSEEIVLSYSDPRIRYIKNLENLKLVKTLNKGLDLCQGEYIARMDADDIALPTKLEKQIAYLDTHPEVIVCGTQIERFGLNKCKKKKISWIRTNNEEIKAQLLLSSCFAHPTVVIRSSVIKEFNFKYDANYEHMEDYKMWADLAKIGNFYNIPESLLRYRLTEGQICSKYKDLQVDKVREFRRYLVNQFLGSFEDGFELPNNILMNSLHKVKELEKEFGDHENVFEFSAVLIALYLSIKPDIVKFLFGFDYLRKGFSISQFIQVLKFMNGREKYMCLAPVRS
ncbi:glycosyltransferase family 2 protein [Labilibaculum euxinus]